MIFGLAGYATCGKNMLADLVSRHYDVKQIAFADALRNTLYATNPLLDVDGTRVNDAVAKYGYNGVKSSKYGDEFRRLLQTLGTDGVRDNISDSAWVDVVLDKITSGGNWIITDVRFKNEIEAVTKAGGNNLWIRRPGVGPANGHSSENSVTELDCEFTIYNHGTPSDMVRQFKSIVKTLH